jgi:cysteine-rich repeat protein
VVLILEPTVFNGLLSNEAVNAMALGFDVDIATAAEWGAMTAQEFASYDALILGDTCGSVEQVAAAEANRAVWSSVTTGNIVMIGTDPSVHLEAGGDAVNNRGINFAASGDGTGLFASLSCYYHGTAPNTPVPLFASYGMFTVTGVGCFDDAHIVAEHPALDGLTDDDLSNWSCSVHEAFDSFPPTFIPLAIAEGAVGAGSMDFPDESFGIPYILARGASPLFCGDGFLDENFEECDDGNTDDGDGCSSICTLELVSCGDGILDAPPEECDDGNDLDGDGCSSFCQLEDALVHAPQPLPDWPEAIQLKNSQDNAYIALQESGLDIYDVVDRDNADWLSNFSASAECSPQEFFADEVALLDEVDTVDAIISAGECGVVGAEVTDPMSPTYIDKFPIPFGFAEEVAGIDSEDGENLILYAASFWQGLQIFEIIGDCTSSCDVEQRGSIGIDDEWGASVAIWIEVIFPDLEEEGAVIELPQVLAYVASTEGLQIVDVTDPDAPILLGRLDTNPTGIPLSDLDDVPQDVVVSGGLAFVPIWIGGLIVVDVQDPTHPIEIQRIPASPNTAFFKVEVSSRDNRIYVTEGISGLTSFIQLQSGQLALEKRIPIGAGDGRCTFDDGVSDICWAWAVDEVGELVGVTYGVLASPQAGGFQLISMPTVSVEGAVLKRLSATPVPEPHLLVLQGVGVLALAGLARRRRAQQRRAARS